MGVYTKAKKKPQKIKTEKNLETRKNLHEEAEKMGQKP